MALTSEIQMRLILDQIITTDKKFKKVTQESHLCPINSKRTKRTHYEVLVSSILSQQLFVKAAETIRARLVDLLKGEITPEGIAKLKSPAIREVGKISMA
jgi:DNA-3-methyladenine glycosylase II